MTLSLFVWTISDVIGLGAFLLIALMAAIIKFSEWFSGK